MLDSGPLNDAFQLAVLMIGFYSAKEFIPLGDAFVRWASLMFRYLGWMTAIVALTVAESKMNSLSLRIAIGIASGLFIYALIFEGRNEIKQWEWAKYSRIKLMSAYLIMMMILIIMLIGVEKVKRDLIEFAIPALEQKVIFLPHPMPMEMKFLGNPWPAEQPLQQEGPSPSTDVR